MNEQIERLAKRIENFVQSKVTQPVKVHVSDSIQVLIEVALCVRA